jgi:hypothetical protein
LLGNAPALRRLSLETAHRNSHLYHLDLLTLLMLLSLVIHLI